MNIEYSKENDIGLFRLGGAKRYYEARLAWWRFLQAFKEDNIKAILVFDNSVNEITPADVLDLEQWFSEINFPRSRKIAIINSDDRKDLINKYWDFVGRIKRWSIKVFDNERSARRWLNSDSRPRKYGDKPIELGRSCTRRAFDAHSLQTGATNMPMTKRTGG